jgi:hypothetical protein
MAQTRVRVVGSGFTTFNYKGQPIAFMDRVDDSGQAAFSTGGQGFEAIIPIGAEHPVEIATSRVLNLGTLACTIRELWNEPIWWQLVGLSGTETITDVWAALALDQAETTCQMIIKPPGSPTWRSKVYHNCVVVGIQDGESVEVGALSVQKNITIAYTHTTVLRQAAG